MVCGGDTQHLGMSSLMEVMNMYTELEVRAYTTSETEGSVQGKGVSIEQADLHQDRSTYSLHPSPFSGRNLHGKTTLLNKTE